MGVLELLSKIPSIIKALYSNAVNCVRVDGNTRDCFLIKTGVCQGCNLAPYCFDVAMNLELDRSTHRAIHGATLGPEEFTHFDCADDVALLSELLRLLLSVPKMFAEEAASVGMTVNWKITTIQSLMDFLPPLPDLTVSGEQVEVVTTVAYLGASISTSSRSHLEIARRGMARATMLNLDRIWRSRVGLQTKHYEATTLQHLHQTHCSICLRDLNCYQV